MATSRPVHHRDLDVWQKSIELVELIYRLSARFPDNEKFGLTSQIRRSAVSIPANIAEGAGRNGTREFIRFLGIARGSLAKTETHLTLSMRLGLTDADQAQPVRELMTTVGKMLTRLKQALME